MAIEGQEISQVDLVSNAVATAGMSESDAKARLDEEAAVRKFFKQFEDDQAFDKPIREQIRRDRTYASGEAQAAWAVSTNMIGAAIDTQTSTLYARDPDVSARPAPQVDPPPDPVTGIIPPQPERQRREAMAKSIELVISALWKKGKLKPRMRRVIRSILSASHGWLKILPVTQRQPDPLAQNEYNTLQANLQSVKAQQDALAAGQTLEGNIASADDLTVQAQQLQTSMEALANKLEVEVCYGFTFDVVKPENMQVGTDVELLEEYLDSDSLTEIMYFPHSQLREKFPDLADVDLLSAEKFYRKPPVNANKGASNNVVGQMIEIMYPNQGFNDDLYTQTNPQDGAMPMARILEKWNKVDNHIYTGISGVKVWARKPYMPSWASSRWYPFFYFSINEVDGQRCPQSMASRGAKLQDEYASVRSNLRIVRKRSIPGTLVDASALDDENLKKIQDGVIAEVTPVKTTMPGQDLSKMFAAKPVPNVDIRLYDTSPIVTDFERTFALSETQQQAKTVETTATEEEIKAASSNNRNTTWRDMIELVLSDAAQYCTEVALQKIPYEVAAKIAGPAVFWPHGMSLEDITSLVEVNIAAGTTGKPRNLGDREAWGVILPQLRETAVQAFDLAGNPQTLPLANALYEQIRETMRRFGEEGDVSRFIPLMPPTPTAPVVPGMPPDAPGASGAAGAAGIMPPAPATPGPLGEGVPPLGPEGGEPPAPGEPGYFGPN